MFVTPQSASILSSITNKVLQTLAEDMGLKVERRRVHVNELENFSEVAGLSHLLRNFVGFLCRPTDGVVLY